MIKRIEIKVSDKKYGGLNSEIRTPVTVVGSTSAEVSMNILIYILESSHLFSKSNFTRAESLHLFNEIEITLNRMITDTFNPNIENRSVLDNWIPVVYPEYKTGWIYTLEVVSVDRELNIDPVFVDVTLGVPAEAKRSPGRPKAVKDVVTETTESSERSKTPGNTTANLGSN